MFKRLLSKLFPASDRSQVGASSPSGEVQNAASDILYSLPTLCGPGPAAETGTPPERCQWLGEDDWRQVEFAVSANLRHIEQELVRLAAFKAQHRHGPGWTDIYTRAEYPAPLATAGLHFGNLPALTSSPLVIGDGPPWGGLVKGGFALTDGTDWFIYGQRAEDGRVIQLAVSPGRSMPSDRFASALSEITETSNLVLVDWLAGALVDTTSTETLFAWIGRYSG